MSADTSPGAVGELHAGVIGSLCRFAHAMAREKGFWDKPRNDGEAIALMHSELSEALEALRHGNPPSEHIPEFSGLEEELADELIRIFDFCGGNRLRLGEAVIAKMKFNAGRGFRHGKHF